MIERNINSLRQKTQKGFNFGKEKNSMVNENE